MTYNWYQVPYTIITRQTLSVKEKTATKTTQNDSRKCPAVSLRRKKRKKQNKQASRDRKKEASSPKEQMQQRRYHNTSQEQQQQQQSSQQRISERHAGQLDWRKKERQNGLPRRGNEKERKPNTHTHTRTQISTPQKSYQNETIHQT